MISVKVGSKVWYQGELYTVTEECCGIDPGLCHMDRLGIDPGLCHMNDGERNGGRCVSLERLDTFENWAMEVRREAGIVDES